MHTRCFLISVRSRQPSPAGSLCLPPVPRCLCCPSACAQTCCTWCWGRIPWASNSIPSGDSQEWTKAQQVQKKNPKGFQKELCFRCWMEEIEVTAALCSCQQTPTSPTTLAPTQTSKLVSIRGGLLHCKLKVTFWTSLQTQDPAQTAPSQQATHCSH